MSRFTVNALASAVLTALSFGAQAAITPGNLNGDGELFLIAYDPVSTNTFVKDLGYNFSVLQANTANSNWFTTINLGALVTPGTGAGQFSFANGVKWTIAAQNRPVGSTATSFSRGNNGFFTTVNTTSSSANLLTGANGGLGNSVTNANNTLSAIQTVINNKAGSLNQVSLAAPISDAGDFNVDASFVVDPAAPQSFDFAWGDRFNNTTGFLNAAGTVGVDSELAFYYFFRSNTPTAINRELQTGGQFRLSSAGVLTYGAAVMAPIPAPAAVWMFVPALLSLVKRKSPLNLA